MEHIIDQEPTWNNRLLCTTQYQCTGRLQQIQSLFPLVLIACSYLCVELHTRNCKLIVWLWRPLYSTFFLLSFFRFIIQLYYLLSFQYTYRLGFGLNQSASLLYDPSVPYFHPSNHLPFVLVLLFIFFTVVLPPIMLLAFYQFRAFHRILICLHLHKFPFIHIFVDLFHGCFKDGTCGSDVQQVSTYYFEWLCYLDLLVATAHCWPAVA